MGKSRVAKIDRDFIAAKAGVSPSTVSRVYNNPELVDPAKVASVYEAAKKYNYTPNKMASALRRKDTGVISFLSLNMQESPLEWKNYLWSFAYALQGTQEIVDKSNYHLDLKTLTKENAGRLLDAKRCDGIVTYHLDAGLAKRVKASGIPYVIAPREYSKEYNTVFLDEVVGGQIAGEHLKATGHKKFAFVGYPSLVDNASRDRCEGFRRAINTEPIIFEGNAGIKGGYEQGKLLVKEIWAKKIDAIFVVNDLTAFGVIQALLAAGIKIPEQVSIMGYDNMPYIEALPFKLATIQIPIFETYKIAAEALLKLIKTGEKVYRGVKPSLVAGTSVINRN